MKLFALRVFCIILSVLGISASYAYTPSAEVDKYLDAKISEIEVIITRRWESFRGIVITLLEETLKEKAYLSSSTQKFTYVITYLIDWIKKEPKILTINDFSDSYDGFTIVQYPDQIVATVRNTWPFGQTNDDSFQNLAGFIFWDNTSGTEIAMTSPVTRTQLDPTTYETAFIMPDGWTLSSLPTPNNDRVTIKTLPWSLKAVKRFSWRVTKDTVDAQRARFQEDLTAAGIVRYWLPTLSQYDWPRVAASSRRNELWVELNQKEWVF